MYAHALFLCRHIIIITCIMEELKGGIPLLTELGVNLGVNRTFANC